MLVCLFVFALMVGTAQAFTYHMRYGQAKNATKELAKTSCAEDIECRGYGVGSCHRVSESRFDCVMALFYAGPTPEEEIECNTMLHWGASYSGYVQLKNHGRPYCFPIKA
jgi:hypothetical protein